MMSLETLLQKRFKEEQFFLNGFKVFEIIGEDATRFLQGQTTNNVNALKPKTFQLNCRLKRTGHLLSYFYLLKDDSSFYLLIPNNLADITIEDLDKFIIMEDVEIKALDKKVFVSLNKEISNSYMGNFLGERAFINFDSSNTENYDSKNLDLIRFINGFPLSFKENTFVNQTRFNDLAVDYKKGCFLGQETAAKLESRRDVSYYPVVLKLDGKISLKEGDLLYKEGKKIGEVISILEYEDNTLIEASLFRQYRLDQSELSLEIDNKPHNVLVYTYPLLGIGSDEQKAKELYHMAIDHFNNDEELKALELLDKALSIDSTLADAYESRGVILGRLKRFDEAIIEMDKLLEVDPNSIMAHSNKSLYLMNLGKIEEAEAEKEKATVKTFKKASSEAKVKKEKEAEIKKREEMFKQVLEIDPEDTLANYGLADISFSRGEFDKSIELSQKVILHDSKHSNAYLLLGKSYKELKRLEEAKKAFEKGIEVAMKKGELMPANEMKAQLLRI